MSRNPAGHPGPPAECFLCKATFADPLSLAAHRPRVRGPCMTADEMARAPGWQMVNGHWTANRGARRRA